MYSLPEAAVEGGALDQESSAPRLIPLLFTETAFHS